MKQDSQTWPNVVVGDTAARRRRPLEDTIFLAVLFLTQFAVPCNVLSTKPLFLQLTHKFSERLDASCSKAKAFRIVETGQ